MDLHFAWQAWHLVTWIVTLPGRCGTYGTGLALVARLGPELTAVDAAAFCVAGVTLGDINLHFAWQAWHLWHWAGTGGVLGTEWTGWTPRDRHFAWQVWHLWHWAGSGGALGSGVDAVEAAAFCVAGVALGDMDLHFAWQAWHLVTWIVTLRGRRGTYGTGLALVARLGRSGRGGRRGFLRGRRGTW